MAYDRNNLLEEILTPENKETFPCQNTDKEIWRERPGDYYSDSIHATKDGGIGINCGGRVMVLAASKWFELANDRLNEIDRRAPHPDGLREALYLLYIDGHLWSRRPCATCSKVTASLGFDFGCIRYAKDKAAPIWKETPPDNETSDWWCTKNHRNGCHLSVCSACGRKPGDTR
jgi:hypothetical protein